MWTSCRTTDEVRRGVWGRYRRAIRLQILDVAGFAEPPPAGLGALGVEVDQLHSATRRSASRSTGHVRKRDLDDVTVGSEMQDRKGLQKARFPLAVRHAAVGGHPRPLIAVLGPRVTSPQTSRFHSIVGTSGPSASSFEFRRRGSSPA